MALPGAMKWFPALVSSSIFTYIRRRLKETPDTLGD